LQQTLERAPARRNADASAGHGGGIIGAEHESGWFPKILALLVLPQHLEDRGRFRAQRHEEVLPLEAAAFDPLPWNTPHGHFLIPLIPSCAQRFERPRYREDLKHQREQRDIWQSGNDLAHYRPAVGQILGLDLPIVHRARRIRPLWLGGLQPATTDVVVERVTAFVDRTRRFANGQTRPLRDVLQPLE